MKVVELSYERENIKELAHEMKLRPELIYRWRSEFATLEGKSFPGNGKKKMTHCGKDFVYGFLCDVNLKNEPGRIMVAEKCFKFSLQWHTFPGRFYRDYFHSVDACGVCV